MGESTTKHCKQCKKDKPLQEFTKAKLNKNWKKSDNFKFP